MVRNLILYVRHPQYRSAGLTFLLMSILFALWIIRLPDIRDKLLLSESDIGIALFFIPIGAICAMLISHTLNKKFGEGRLMGAALFLTAATSLLPVIAPSHFWLCIGLMCFGFSTGLTDIAMNALVSVFEKRDKVQIMSVSHGFFSLGGIVGPLLGGVLYTFDLPIAWQLGAAAVVVILINSLVIIPTVGHERDMDHTDHKDPVFALPKGHLIPLSVIAFCAMMGEGAIADWSAIYLDDVVNASAATLGFGYAAFSTTMTIGRFYGDTLTARLGRSRVVIAGCILAIIGIGLVLTAEFPVVLAGFAVVGIGLSTLIPVLFSVAGSVPGISSSFGIASVATAGYSGFLLGPVVLGFLAEYQGLQVSFLLIIVLAVISLITALRGI